jgi:putative transposase
VSICARPTQSRVCSPPSDTRTVRTRGALSQDTARLMVFKLVMAAARAWRRLKGEAQLPKVVQGVTFKDGVEAPDTPAQTGA